MCRSTARRAHRALLLARQPDRAARTGAAAHRPARRRAAADPHAGARHPGPGRPASAFSSASTSIRAAPALVRYARRLADRLRAPWTALYVETPRSAGCPRPSATGSPTPCAWPSSSAARRSPFPGQNVAEDIVRYAAAQQFHPHRHRQADQAALARTDFDGSVTHDLIRKAGDISVHVISGTERDAQPTAAWRRRRQRRRRGFDLWPYLVATACVAGGARRSALVLDQFLDVRNRRAGLPHGGADLAR